LDQENEWNLKIHTLWLHVRDENTKLFHEFSNQWNSINTIWKIDDPQGSIALTFEDIASVGVQHFHNLFKEDSKAPIKVSLQLTYHFPCFVDQDYNDQVMVEVSKEEI